VGVDGIEAVARERHPLAVHDEQAAFQPLPGEVATGEIDRDGREVDAGDAGAGAGEAGQVDAGATADLEQVAAAVAGKIDDARQVVELVEAVAVQLLEEFGRAYRVRGDLEIMNVLVPVGGDL
jgi:hypothetical protein